MTENRELVIDCIVCEKEQVEFITDELAQELEELKKLTKWETNKKIALYPPHLVFRLPIPLCKKHRGNRKLTDLVGK